jgi:hypothetical protein
VAVELGAGFAALRESAHLHLRADGLLGMGPVWDMVPPPTLHDLGTLLMTFQENVR